MPKYGRPSEALMKNRRRAGGIQTVVTFGALTLLFQNVEQDQVVVPSNPDDDVQEVWVSCTRAVQQIETRLRTAGYTIDSRTSPISNWAEEKYHWLPTFAKCRSCGHLQSTRGIEATQALCKNCNAPTKGNWDEVYVSGKTQIPVKFIRGKGLVPLKGNWPLPPCVHVVHTFML